MYAPYCLCTHRGDLSLALIAGIAHSQKLHDEGHVLQISGVFFFFICSACDVYSVLYINDVQVLIFLKWTLSSFIGFRTILVITSRYNML